MMATEWTVEPARGPLASQSDWREREWAVLAKMARAKGLVLYRAECGHSEYFNAGQEPTKAGPCTRCFIKGRVG